MVVAGLLVPLGVAHARAARARALPLALERDHRDLLEHEVGQRRPRDVRVAHHHAEAETLAVPPRRRERDLPVLLRVEPAGPLLQVAPRGAQVELLPERDPRERLDRALDVEALERGGREVAGQVRHQALSVAGHHVVGRRRRHHDVRAGQDLLGRVLRERALVQAVTNRGRRAPVVAVPVVAGTNPPAGRGTKPAPPRAAAPARKERRPCFRLDEAMSPPWRYAFRIRSQPLRYSSRLMNGAASGALRARRFS